MFVFTFKSEGLSSRQKYQGSISAMLAAEN